MWEGVVGLKGLKSENSKRNTLLRQLDPRTPEGCQLVQGPLKLLHQGAHQENMMTMMVSLEQQIKREQVKSGTTILHICRCQVEVEDWMITLYEVEFKHKIRSSGLYVIFRCTIVYLLIMYFFQWPSLHRELEQDKCGAQGADDGP